MNHWTCDECASTNRTSANICGVCSAERTAGGAYPDAPRRRAAPAERPPRRLGPTVLAAVFVAALALLAAYPQVSRWLAQAGDSVASEPPTVAGDDALEEPTPTSGAVEADEEAAPVEYVGTVRLSQSVIGDPTAVSVAGVFDAYFTAVNNRDHPTVLSLYDPAGVVNPDNATQANALAKAISTTRDSGAELHAVNAAASPPGAVTARVTFVSEQAPGYGPRGREQETCTNWDVTYTLTAGGPRAYRILRSTAANSAC